MGFVKGYCPEAEDYYRETIAIPMYPALEEEDLKRVLDILEVVLTK